MSDPYRRYSLLDPRQLPAIDVTAPGRWYDKTVGAHPIAETGMLAGGGAMAGYFGGGLLARALLKLVGGTLPVEKQQALEEWAADPDNLQGFRNWMGLAGGTLGGLYGLAKHMDTRSGFGGMAQSMVNPKYWEENPAATSQLLARRFRRLATQPYRLKKFEWDRLPKLAAEEDSLEQGDPFFGKEIPVRFSLNTLGRDPFLTIGQKQQSQDLVVGAANGQSMGFTSGHGLMRAALRAGVGFGTAYLFGNLAGKVLSLPPEAVKKLSLGGGIAGALVGSGIFKELGK